MGFWSRFSLALFSARFSPGLFSPALFSAGLFWSLLFSFEVAEGGVFGDQLDGCLVGVLVGWGNQPVPVRFVAGDVPPVVVEQQVVVAAEQDAVGQVGVAAVSFPVHDVVGFGPGRWPVAAGGGASAPEDGEGFFLFAGEETLFAPEVDNMPIVGEDDPGDAGVAGQPPRGPDRHRGDLAPRCGRSRRRPETRLGGGQPQDRGAAAEQEAGVRVRPEFQELFEAVGGELFRGALIGEDLLRQGLPFRVDEPHPTQLRGGGAVIQVPDGGGGFRVHDPHQPRGPIRLKGQTKGPLRPAFVFPQCHPGNIEFVPERPRFPTQRIRVQGCRGRHQLGGRIRQLRLR